MFETNIQDFVDWGAPDEAVFAIVNIYDGKVINTGRIRSCYEFWTLEIPGMFPQAYDSLIEIEQSFENNRKANNGNGWYIVH